MGFGFTLAQAADAVDGPGDGAAETAVDGSAGDAAGGAAAGGDAAPSITDSVKDDTANAWEGLREGDFSAAMPLVEKYVVPAVVAILVLIVAYFVGKFLARTLSSPIKKRVDEALGMFVGKMIFWAIMIFALLGVLGRYGISVAGFAAVLAAAGFAIGMAFQGTLGNFAAGIMLLVFRPFKVGDVINAAGITAKVIEIDLFHTVFDTPDNRRIIVPNGAISGDTIENVTFHPVRRCDVVVGADYGASIDATRAALEKAAQSLGEMLVEGEGRGYKIVLGDLGDSSVAWTVRFWCKTAEYWDVKEALTRAVKMHLDEAGIGIPFPQMDVHLVKDEG